MCLPLGVIVIACAKAIFTAGAMGAGKGHTVAWMDQHNYFPVEDITHIDPDAFRMQFPEWDE